MLPSRLVAAAVSLALSSALSSLPPGEYLVVFARNGYSELFRRTVLRLSQTSRIDARLSFGDTVVVTATPTTALETPHVSTNLPLKEVERLPVLRNQLD